MKMQIHILQDLETEKTPSENNFSSSHRPATMMKTIFLVFLCAAVQEGLGENVFVPLEMKWSEAQAYCREKHFDLSAIGSQSDQESLKAAAGGTFMPGWIGLYREDMISFEWKWSGGEVMTYENWGKGQPDNFLLFERFVEIMANGKWNDQNTIARRPFYCSRGKQVKKTWEEALEHCRETHNNLTSLHSKTEKLLTLKKMQNNNITEPVWIGLRFLGDRWLWVNGEPLVYQAWPEGDQDHECPIWRRCGALTKEGMWKNWDCQEKLNFICK